MALLCAAAAMARWAVGLYNPLHGMPVILAAAALGAASVGILARKTPWLILGAAIGGASVMGYFVWAYDVDVGTFFGNMG